MILHHNHHHHHHIQYSPPPQNTSHLSIHLTGIPTTQSYTMAPPNVAIVIYSMYGHIATLAEAEKAGIEAAGGKATIFQ